MSTKKTDSEKRNDILFRGLKTRIKNSCRLDGLRIVQLKLEFLKSNPGTELPVKSLTYGTTIHAYELAISEYIENYNND